MEPNRETLLLAFPLLVLVAVAEAGIIVSVKKQTYDWRESLASLGVAIGGRLLRFATVGLVSSAAYWAWQWRLFTLPPAHIGYWPALIVLEEFLYYWFHRLNHTCRWFWASHAVHHSPNHFYLSGAYRLGWTGAVTGGFLFFTPLFLIGFHPKDVFMVIGINLLYQYWLHTELVGRLPGFDWLFNSPANHRVHHASDARYLDKNFGGVLMVFDHCFGTYQTEDRKNPIQQYGVAPVLNTYNPIRIALHEWLRIGADLKRQNSWLGYLKVLFGKP
ncbi:sterol desaturase family protein [Methylosoma difficile]